MNITFEVDTNFELDLTLVFDVKEEPHSIASFHCLANAGECSPLTLTIHTPKMEGDGESATFCASVVADLCQQSSMGPVSPSCKSKWFGRPSTWSKDFSAALSTPSQAFLSSQNSKILIGNMNLDLMITRMSLGYSFCSDLVIHRALYPILEYRVNEKHQ